MEEIWKDIKEYEGLYQVSNLGRIRSLDRYRKTGISGYIQRGRILIGSKRGPGYLGVSLTKKDVKKSVLIHRIVAETFIPNPDGKKEVNHKNGIKTDNRVMNLEWSTRKENEKHSYVAGLSRARRGTENILSKGVIQYDLQMNKLKEYGSIREVQRERGYNNSFIGACCKGKHKTAYGYIWKYKE